jgi:hypothetical protein
MLLEKSTPTTRAAPREIYRVDPGAAPDVEDHIPGHIPGLLERDGVALEDGFPERRIDPTPQG